MAACAFAVTVGFGVVGCCLESAFAALVLSLRGLGAGLETVGDAADEFGLAVGKLSLTLDVSVAGVPAASAGGAFAVGGNRDAGFWAVWQEVVPRTTVTQSALRA
jgi:hypothetical protein